MTPDQVPNPLVAVGDVVLVPEADYCYGRGPLRLRITEQPAGLDRPGLEWIELTGRELMSIGGDLRDGRPRTALVRLAALRANPPHRPGPAATGGRDER